MRLIKKLCKLLPYRTRLRLQTDHHFLKLEKFDRTHQSWQALGETYIEHITDSVLASWLQTLSKQKYTEISLLIREDSFQFETYKPLENKTALSDSVEFMKEIQQALNLDEEAVLLDAIPQGAAYQVAILQIATIEAYLQAFKNRHIVIKRIAPFSDQALLFNLVNWRLLKKRIRLIQRMLRLIFLPIIVLTIILIFLQIQAIKLAELKARNSDLKQQISLVKDSQEGINISLAHALITQLIAEKTVRAVTINQSGKVSLTGQASSSQNASLTLQRLAALPEFKAKSTHNWTFYHSPQGGIWTVAFLLKGTN